MKDWSKERWRKLYVREALEQRPWPVMARGLRDYLLRLADDDGGLIRDADDPLGALLVALGAHESEAELVRVALELLRRDGFLTGSARSIFVGNLPAAQSWHSPQVSEIAQEAEVAASSPRTSTERVRRHRERLRQAAAAEPPTLRSAATGNVSEGPDTSTTRQWPRRQVHALKLPGDDGGELQERRARTALAHPDRDICRARPVTSAQ